MTSITLRLRFFKEPNTGNIPAQRWIQGLRKHDRKKIGTDLRKIQTLWPVGMPLVRNMRNGLWELRSTLRNKEARVFFIVDAGELHTSWVYQKKASHALQRTRNCRSEAKNTSF